MSRAVRGHRPGRWRGDSGRARASDARLDLRAALPAWVGARAIVAVALVVATVVRVVFDPTLPEIGPQQRQGLLGWDAAWYLAIATDGYEALPSEGLRFFPLYPLITRAAGAVVGSDALALLVIANGAALVYGALVHRLVRTDLGDEGLARTSAALVALAPIAFVCTMGYTEPLAGVASVTAFLCASRSRWGGAALSGVAAGALRPVGILLAIPLAIEAAQGWAGAHRRERVGRAVAVASPLIGTAPYLAWVGWRLGDPWLPFSVQRVPGLRGPLANPFVTVADALGHLDGRDVVLGLRGLWALALAALVVVAARRLPLSYAAYAAVSLAVALSTASLGSLERYGYGAFPLVIAAATLVPRHGLGRRVVLVASGAAMGAYATLAFLDRYVP